MLETATAVAGVDEVGRGAWAGPLVAAAVILDPAYRIRNVRDSKLLKAEDRERLARRIRLHATAVGVGTVTTDEINDRGFVWALTEAGIRAIKGLAVEPEWVLLDGHHNYFGTRYQCETIINGDAKELCIAAASVIAKVHRDGLMEELHEQHPAYGFARNKGYGTPKHRRVLQELGPTPAHRQAWKPIAALLQQPLPLST